MAHWSIFLLRWICGLIHHNADDKLQPNTISDDMSETMDFLFIPGLSDETLLLFR